MWVNEGAFFKRFSLTLWSSPFMHDFSWRESERIFGMIPSNLQSLKGQRIVVKLGTSTLTDGTPNLSQPRMVDLVRQMSLLRLAKAEVLLVSSGAIADWWTYGGSYFRFTG